MSGASVMKNRDEKWVGTLVDNLCCHAAITGLPFHTFLLDSTPDFLSVNGNFRGSSDAEPDLVAFNGHNGDS